MPVPLTGSTALVPMSRLWRPMARTDRNRERRAPGTPAPTCSPTICRGVRSDKYRSSLGLLARRWPPRSAGCRPRPKQPGASEGRDNQLHRARVLVVRIQSPPAGSQARTCLPRPGMSAFRDANSTRQLRRPFLSTSALARLLPSALRFTHHFSLDWRRRHACARQPGGVRQVSGSFKGQRPRLRCEFRQCDLALLNLRQPKLCREFICNRKRDLERRALIRFALVQIASITDFDVRF